MRSLVALLGLLATAGGLQTQPASPALVFDVVSVKTSAPGNSRSSIDATPGRWATFGTSLRLLVTQAYQVPDDLLIAPDWIRSAFFDIDARMPPGTYTRDQRAVMMRAMLADRFGLRVHREIREIPVYELRFARGDRRLGNGLREPSNNCAIARCSTSVLPLPGGALALTAGALRFESLPRQLQLFVARPVVDKTGLTGEYDVQLRALPEPGATRLFGPDAAGAPPDPDVPTIFTAVREQLGLTLEPTRGPSHVVVVDGVSQPVEIETGQGF